MVRCWYCPGCNEYGQRFQYGCRKCKRGQFKHRKCGRWVTAQYGFCPICYKDRPEPKARKVFNKRDKEKEKEKEIMSRMSRGWRTDTRYVFTDKPTMPKGWVAVTRYEPIDNPTVSEADKPTMPKGWETKPQ